MRLAGHAHIRPAAGAGIVPAGRDGGHPELGLAAALRPGAHLAGPAGRLGVVIRIGGVGYLVHVQAVEHGQVGGIEPLGDPQGRLVRVNLAADGVPALLRALPGGDGQAVHVGEEDDRPPLGVQEVRVTGVGGHHVVQRGHEVVLRRAVGQHMAGEDDGGAEGRAAGLFQQLGEVAVGAVADGQPLAGEPVQPGVQGLLDVAAHGGGVVGVVGLLRPVAEVAVVPAVAVEPGEVVGQDEPFSGCWRRWRHWWRRRWGGRGLGQRLVRCFCQRRRQRRRRWARDVRRPGRYHTSGRVLLACGGGFLCQEIVSFEPGAVAVNFQADRFCWRGGRRGGCCGRGRRPGRRLGRHRRRGRCRWGRLSGLPGRRERLLHEPHRGGRRGRGGGQGRAPRSAPDPQDNHGNEPYAEIGVHTFAHGRYRSTIRIRGRR